MKNTVVYIHGQNGSPEEAKHYAGVFADCDVIGFDYTSEYPWDAKAEFSEYFNSIFNECGRVTLVANSIGAFFAMNALSSRQVEKAYFISPVVNMEKLITDMMSWAGVTEAELQEKGVIDTDFGQQLSWEYLSYVRQHPIAWDVPTHILYGSRDGLSSMQTVSDFAAQTSATLTVMEGGEHWFHTDEQMTFLDDWLKANK